MKLNHLILVLSAMFLADQVKAAGLAVLIPLSVSAIPATTFWGGSYSSSKQSGTFPYAVEAGDDTVRSMEQTLGVKLSKNMVAGARAEAQTFIANNDHAKMLPNHYPMLNAAYEEANRQTSKTGLIVNPYSLAESIANFME